MFKIGQKLICKMGYPANMHESFIHTGDIVEVIGIYPHHILVQNVEPYKDRTEHMRESFVLNDVHSHLAPVRGC